MRQNVGSMRENNVKCEEAEEKRNIINKIFHHYEELQSTQGPHPITFILWAEPCFTAGILKINDNNCNPR